VTPRLTIASTPGTVMANGTTGSCQWFEQLTIQNQGGYFVNLLSLFMDSVDLTGRLQQIFGTMQMGPFGSLQGHLCRSDANPPEKRNFDLLGYTEFGQLLHATTTAMFEAADPSPSGMSVSPGSVTLAVPDSNAPPATATIALNFNGGTPDWTITTLPSSPTTNWLSVSTLSGSGAAQLSITAAPGTLGPGVYTTTLVIQSASSSPEFVNVPVTLLVGDTSKMQIGGVANAASSQLAFAPGMVMAVYGVQLAPDGTGQAASTLPLPLNLVGVSATVNGQPAPMSYASPGQLNIQVPFETSVGPAVLGVNNNGQVAAFPFKVAFAAPGVFTGSDGALAPTSSGKSGDILLAFVTGAGVVTPSLKTGESPSSQTPVDELPKAFSLVQVTVGGVAAKVQFAGVAAGLVGMIQVNFVVPDGVAAGAQPVVVSVGGNPAPAATVTITE
jgi:uncharacterized protein (TIGR03437 family)